MYTSYFGLNEKPFTLTPNPHFIFLSNSHNEALAHLLYGIENHHGFIKLTGEVGTGKTTLLRTLLSQLDEIKYRTALIFNPCISGSDLLRSILHEYNIKPASTDDGDMLNALNQFLLNENGNGHTVVLVIDEAQNLKPEVLEYIRLISNLETENDKLIQIILAGQPELKTLLKKSELRQLNQRIAIRYNLKTMTREETAFYIRHRTDIASKHGGEIFTSGSILPIHLFTHGNPRLINILCDRALLIAYTNEQRVISTATILKAIWELKGLPVNTKESHTAESKTIAPTVKNEVKAAPPEPAIQAEPPDDQETEEIIDLEEIEQEETASEQDYENLFDLGTELMQEIGSNNPAYSTGELVRELAIFDSMTDELNNPALSGGVLLLVLRFASEFMNRAVIFIINDQTISGIGQFSIDGGDDVVRSIDCTLDQQSIFSTPLWAGHSMVLAPDNTPANQAIFKKLGGEIPTRVFVGPIVCNNQVIGFLYGDNLPDNKPIKNTEALETFLSKAAETIKNQLFERINKQTKSGMV